MTPENIRARQEKRRQSAVRSAVLFVVIQLVSAVLLSGLCFLPDLPPWCFVLFLVMAVVDVVTILPAILVLKKRLEEIEGGEEDAAAQY